MQNKVVVYSQVIQKCRADKKHIHLRLHIYQQAIDYKLTLHLMSQQATDQKFTNRSLTISPLTTLKVNKSLTISPLGTL